MLINLDLSYDMCIFKNSLFIASGEHSNHITEVEFPREL